MKNTKFLRKTTACLLSVLMFVSVLFITPVHTFAVENGRPTASTTQIAAGSTVMIKKGAVTADTLEEINAFLTIFEFKVQKVENDVATILYTLNVGKTMDEYGLTVETILKLFDFDTEKYAWVIALATAADAGLNFLEFDIIRNVALEDLTLIKDGVKSTRDELKYIGKEAHINQGAVDANGKEISSIWCVLVYDITTVIDTTAHLQCRLTPGFIEKMGITKEAFGNMIGVDPSNSLYDVLYTALTNAGYTLNFDVDLQYLTVNGVTSDVDSDTDSDKPVVTVKYGDANGDKNIDLNDVVLIQKVLANLSTLTSSKRLAADVTGDGKVNLEDVTTIQKYIAKLITKFPAQNSLG